jgi:D-Tyr-tRNAtyr deacylase
MIVALGIRKDGSKQDVYALAKKLLRLGLLDNRIGIKMMIKIQNERIEICVFGSARKGDRYSCES